MQFFRSSEIIPLHLHEKNFSLDHFPLGFEDDYLSSSLLKSPSEVPPLSRAGSNKKERNDDVFSPGQAKDDDQDIIRDYEAVHGQLHLEDKDQPR